MGTDPRPSLTPQMAPENGFFGVAAASLLSVVMVGAN